MLTGTFPVEFWFTIVTFIHVIVYKPSPIDVYPDCTLCLHTGVIGIHS